MTEKQGNILYSYFFHFNIYTGYWNAVKRDLSVNYLNGKLNEEDVIKNKSIEDLIRFLSK